MNLVFYGAHILSSFKVVFNLCKDMKIS